MDCEVYSLLVFLVVRIMVSKLRKALCPFLSNKSLS